MSIQRHKGFTLVELTTVLAVTAILMAATVPLGSYWIERAKLAEGTGELTHGFGKAIASSLKNQHALDAASAITAVCISDTNQVTVLESLAATELSCATSAGDSVWTTSLPDDLQITSGTNDVSCMCFNANGFLTDAATNCSSCVTSDAISLSIGSRSETLDVF